MEELKQLNIFIIDPSGNSKRLLRTILMSMGIQKIWCASRTDEALETMRQGLFDVVFCDENVGPLSPDVFVKALRCDLTTANVTVPVVLVSSGTGRGRVAVWRDAGGSDVIVKPLSAEVMQLRLKALVLDPKAFVTTKGFIGPDRRRGSTERRQFGERRPPIRDRRHRSEEGIVFSLTTNRAPEAPVDEQ